MKGKKLLYIFALVILVVAVVISYQSGQTTDTKASKEKGLPQLSEKGREKAETMVLLYAPPMQPASHINRWIPELHHESCFTCHGKKGTGAPTPPKDHFYDNNVKGKVARDNCVQCHAQQTDTKTAFNKKK